MQLYPVLKKHHHCPIVHGFGKRFQLCVCRTLVIIIHHVFNGLEHRNCRESEPLPTLIGLGWARCYRLDVWFVILLAVCERLGSCDGWGVQDILLEPYFAFIGRFAKASLDHSHPQF